MPTAGKLVAAVLFAAIAWLAAELFKPAMPEGTPFGHFSLICAGVGAVCGWLVMGRRTGYGASAAISAGIQTSVTLTFFALLGFCIYLMLRRATRLMYDDPMQAIIGVFELMVEHGLLMLTAPVLGTLLLGGVLGGLVTDWTARRWS